MANTRGSGIRFTRRSSGFFKPPEVELRKEIKGLRELIDTIDDDWERLKKLRELNFKITKLNMTRKVPLNLEDFRVYENKIYEKSLG